MNGEGAAPSGMGASGWAPRLASGILAALLAGAWPSPFALAGGTPADALAYLDPSVADAREELALRERALAALPGFDASVTASPTIGYGTLMPGVVTFGDFPAAGAPPSWSAGVALNAVVGYSYDPVALLDGRIALEQARADVAAARRRGVFQALDAHAGLLLAQAAVREDGPLLAAAQREATALPVSSASSPAASSPAASSPSVSSPAVSLPSSSSADVAEARLRLAAARLRSEEDAQRLADLRVRAAGYGLDEEASYVPLRFALPDAADERLMEGTSRYRVAVLQVARARAELQQGLAFGAVQELALSAGVVSGGVGVTARGGVLDSRPRAELDVGYPAGSDGWTLGVSATFVLSTDALRLAEVRRRATRARARLDAYRRSFPARAARLRAEAGFAERELALQERRLALAERAQRDVAAARRGLYGAWAGYVRSVYAYLDLVEAPWRPRGP